MKEFIKTDWLIHDYIQYYMTMSNVAHLIGYDLLKEGTPRELSKDEILEKMKKYQGWLEDSVSKMEKNIRPKVIALVKEYKRMKLQEYMPFIQEFFGTNLPSSAFTTQKASRMKGLAINEVFDNNKIKSGFRIVGWCNGNNVSLSPQEGIAVMFEDKAFEEVWFHFPIHYVASIYEAIKESK